MPRRLWATLDHLTRGRAAWNVVTTLNHNQSANYGEEMKPTDERYDRAHEFMDVCRKLWASWDADAVVMDRDAGIFADPDKVHRVDHEGRFFKSRGPLNVVRSPHHGAPPSCRPARRARAATSPPATPTPCSPSSPTSPAPRRCTTTSSAAWPRPAARQRPARCCSACSRSSAPRAAEAEDKQAEHNALVPLEGGLAILSGHLDFDLSTLPLDTIMAHRTEPKLQRMQTRYRTATGELLTLRQVAQNHGQSVGLPQMVGTPTDIADQLEAYFDQVGGDGFMLSPIYCPGAIEEFVDLVVPGAAAPRPFPPGICRHHAARPSEPGLLTRGWIVRPGRKHRRSLDWSVDARPRLSIDGSAGHRGLQPDLRRRRQPEPTRAQGPADRPDRPGPRHDARALPAACRENRAAPPLWSATDRSAEEGARRGPGRLSRAARTR